MIRCKKCGRLLTDPVSIERGIGPVCAGVGHRTNRYKKPKKRAAYECALKLAEQIDDIWQRGIYWDIFSRLDPDLSREDRRQVAAKAVRVTRGIRKVAEDRVSRLKSEFDDLVREREKERLAIHEDVENSDHLYLALEQAVIEKAKELEEARYALRYL